MSFIEFFKQKLVINWRYYKSIYSPFGESELRELRKHGVVIRKGIAQDWMNRVLNELKGLEGPMQLGSQNIYEVREKAPSSKRFFEDKSITQLVEAYLDGGRSYRKRFSKRIALVSGLEGIQLYHFDDWKPRVKVFLYLSEVTSKNAPMIYLKGSHRSKFAWWRMQKEYQYFRYFRIDDDYNYLTPEAKDCGCFLLPDITDLKARHGWEEVECVGPMGTVIVFDTTGLHRGQPFNTQDPNATRLLLENSFK